MKTVRMVRPFIHAIRYWLNWVVFKRADIWRDQSVVSASFSRNISYEQLAAMTSTRSESRAA